MMSRPIAYSRGESLRDVQPRLHEVADLDELVDVLRRDPGRQRTKSRSPYICGPLSGPRSVDTALPKAWVAVDADFIEPTVMPGWRAFWRQHDAIIWPTHSSRPEAPRDRVIIGLDKPASRAECLAIGSQISGVVSSEFGDTVPLDKSTFRPEQPVFLPPINVDLVRTNGSAFKVSDQRRPQASQAAQEAADMSSVGLCCPQLSSVLSVGVAWSSVGEGLSLEDLPVDCVPTRPGERNRCLFALARLLKAQRPDATLAEQHTFAARWHSLVADRIGTKLLRITLADFARAFTSIRQPRGNLMEEITATAATMPVPPILHSLGYGEQGTTLYRVCAALAKHNGTEPFFLSARTAAQVSGLHFTDAAAVLRCMVEDGLLELVRQGSGRVASRYRLRAGHDA